MNSKSTFKGVLSIILLLIFFAFNMNGEGKKNNLNTLSKLSKGVRFQSLGFKDALHQAEYRKQPVFLYIGSASCLQSQRMNDVFKMKDVSLLLNSNFYCNKFNTESIIATFKASSNWDVKHYPSYLFFAGNGKLIMKAEGYMPQAKFIELVKKALDEVYTYEVAKGIRKPENVPLLDFNSEMVQVIEKKEELSATVEPVPVESAPAPAEPVSVDAPAIVEPTPKPVVVEPVPAVTEPVAVPVVVEPTSAPASVEPTQVPIESNNYQTK